MVRYDIYNKFKEPTHVAYCYQGYYVGALAFYNNNEEIVKLLLPQDYLLDTDMVRDYKNRGKEEFNRFELWSYIHEIEDNDLRGEALNMLYRAYCIFYSNSEFLRNTKFAGFNDEIIPE